MSNERKSGEGPLVGIIGAIVIFIMLSQCVPEEKGCISAAATGSTAGC